MNAPFLNLNNKKHVLLKQARRRLVDKWVTVRGGGVPTDGRIVGIHVATSEVGRKRIFCQILTNLGTFSFPLEAIELQS